MIGPTTPLETFLELAEGAFLRFSRRNRGWTVGFWLSSSAFVFGSAYVVGRERPTLAAIMPQEAPWAAVPAAATFLFMLIVAGALGEFATRIPAELRRFQANADGQAFVESAKLGKRSKDFSKKRDQIGRECLTYSFLFIIAAFVLAFSTRFDLESISSATAIGLLSAPAALASYFRGRTRSSKRMAEFQLGLMSRIYGLLDVGALLGGGGEKLSGRAAQSLTAIDKDYFRRMSA